MNEYSKEGRITEPTDKELNSEWMVKSNNCYCGRLEKNHCPSMNQSPLVSLTRYCVQGSLHNTRLDQLINASLFNASVTSQPYHNTKGSLDPLDESNVYLISTHLPF